jgi:hypothetical protein
VATPAQVAASPTVAAGRRVVPAPIDGVEVRVAQSAPPRYFAHIRAGLPSGCAQRHGSSVSRSGDVFQVTVTNTMPEGNVVCTQIYGSYELDVELPGPFVSGTAYTVHVNDKTTTFRAQ